MIDVTTCSEIMDKSDLHVTWPETDYQFCRNAECCFCLVLPTRTYFLAAQRPSEAYRWRSEVVALAPLLQQQVASDLHHSRSLDKPEKPVDSYEKIKRLLEVSRTVDGGLFCFFLFTFLSLSAFLRVVLMALALPLPSFLKKIFLPCVPLSVTTLLLP